MSRVVEPPGWPRPRGYSHAVAAHGEQLFIAGQIGCNDDGALVAEVFLEQVRAALRNVVTVLHAAGGAPEHLTRLTWYVTDKREYLESRSDLGEIYREVLGTWYPAMTLVEVAALLHDGAKVEIEATAVLPCA